MSLNSVSLAPESGTAMKLYPPELLAKIKSSLNLVHIVREEVPLKRSGSNYSGPCPFHTGADPSFCVSEAKQVFHCYGCKFGGDIFGFVMKLRQVTFEVATVELAKRAEIPLEESTARRKGIIQWPSGKP